MQHLQGDLQVVFDALYEMGVIEPILKVDWRSGLEEIQSGSPKLTTVISIVNTCGRDRLRLKEELLKLDQASLEILAMEVAREYADFHQRLDLH